MSDPVTNVEIEDVLSSIRKLVNEGEQARTRDSAPEQAPAEPAVAPVAAPAAAPESKPDRLILTPAFLVAEDAAVQDDPAEEATADPDVSQIVWTEEALVLGQDAAVKEETAEPEPQEMVAEPEAHETAAEPEPEPEAIEVEADLQADPAIEEPSFEDRNADLVAAIAELEASVNDQAEEFEPDGSEEEASEVVSTIVWPRSHREQAPADDAETVEETAGAAHSPTPEESAEPENDWSDLNAAEDVSVDETDLEDDDIDAYLAGDKMIDEEALRDMVAEIVREELQGNLGERITRNVRKLVRREIYRILSSQDFE